MLVLIVVELVLAFRLHNNIVRNSIYFTHPASADEDKCRVLRRVRREKVDPASLRNADSAAVHGAN